MNPGKALELVNRYARLTKGIKDCTKHIGDHLSKCCGIEGNRLAVDEHGWPTYQPELDEKNRDKGLHIWSWYQPEYTEGNYYSEPRPIYEAITAEEHGVQCQHCYSAHLSIQARKEMRKSLGVVKAAITRWGGI